LEPDLPLREVFVIGGRGAAPAAWPSGLACLPYEALHEGQAAHVPERPMQDRAPLSYLYTSGTTSAPKGVVGSHLAIYLESLGTAIDTGMSGRDRALAMMPMFHTAQLNAICTPVVAAGGAILVMKGFDAQQLLDLIEQ